MWAGATRIAGGDPTSTFRRMVAEFSRRGVLASVAVLIVTLVCVRLGFWQLDRLEQRRAQNALVKERESMPPLQGALALTDTGGKAYRRVVLDGTIDRGRAIVLARRAWRGTPGVHLLVPLREPTGAAVMVDLGFVPSPDAARVDLSAVDLPERVRLTGVATPYPAPRVSSADRTDARVDTLGRAGGGALFHLDAPTVAQRVPYPVAPMYVKALPEPGATSVPRRVEPPALTEGPHLGYALQWFGFAAVAVIGWGVLVLRGRGARVPLREDPL